jgi:hypothetical protein
MATINSLVPNPAAIPEIGGAIEIGRNDLSFRALFLAWFNLWKGGDPVALSQSQRFSTINTNFKEEPCCKKKLF